MPPAPGPNRRDILIWGLGAVLGILATLVSLAGSARLGAALTGGVIVLVVVVVAGLALDNRSR
jgi:hypothetical protein